MHFIKKKSFINSLSVIERRRFLKTLGVILSSPIISPALRFALGDQFGGELYAQGISKVSNFIEINLRDTWHWGHCFQSPTLARQISNGSVPINNSRTQSFFQSGLAYYHGSRGLTDAGNNLYLTPDSIALRAHANNIAVFEMNEPVGGPQGGRGTTHGHEASNPARIPGRNLFNRANNGQMPVWINDIGDPGNGTPQGNIRAYADTPSLDCFHNHTLRSAGVARVNGLVFKGISRGHDCYHFDYNLKQGKMTNVNSFGALLQRFPNSTQDLNLLKSANEREAVLKAVKSLDESYFKDRNVTRNSVEKYLAQVDGSKNDLYDPQNTKTIDLRLSNQERDFWSQGVPAQNQGNGDNQGRVKMNIWEQVAYAYKLISSGRVKTISMEFDYIDVHHNIQRNELTTMARQVSLPLARLIQKLKEDNIFDDTVIQINSLDGSRHPRAFSYSATNGNDGSYYGLNTSVVAGGKVRGGYYGDIKYENNRYNLYNPNFSTGAVDRSGYRPTIQNYNRFIRGGILWKTIARGMGMPTSSYNGFNSLRNLPYLDFLFRS